MMFLMFHLAFLFLGCSFEDVENCALKFNHHCSKCKTKYCTL